MCAKTLIKGRLCQLHSLNTKNNQKKKKKKTACGRLATKPSCLVQIIDYIIHLERLENRDSILRLLVLIGFGYIYQTATTMHA